LTFCGSAEVLGSDCGSTASLARGKDRRPPFPEEEAVNPQEMSHHWTRSDSPRRRKIIAGIGSTLCILAVAITVVIQAQMAKAFDEAFDEALSETAVAEDSEQPADAPEDAPAHNSGEDVTRLGFGATHRWSGGEVITVSKPSPYK